MRSYIINVNVNLNADGAEKLAKSVTIKLKKNNPDHSTNNPHSVPYLKLVKK